MFFGGFNFCSEWKDRKFVRLYFYVFCSLFILGEYEYFSREGLFNFGVFLIVFVNLFVI